MNIGVNPLAKVFKVLGDETRFRILGLLLRHDLCVDALAARLEVGKSAVSQHLKVLREAGLVRGEKRGYFTHYSVERERLKEAAAGLEAMAATTKKRCAPGDGCFPSGTCGKE